MIAEDHLKRINKIKILEVEHLVELVQMFLNFTHIRLKIKIITVL